MIRRLVVLYVIPRETRFAFKKTHRHDCDIVLAVPVATSRFFDPQWSLSRPSAPCANRCIGHRRGSARSDPEAQERVPRESRHAAVFVDAPGHRRTAPSRRSTPSIWEPRPVPAPKTSPFIGALCRRPTRRRSPSCSWGGSFHRPTRLNRLDATKPSATPCSLTTRSTECSARSGAARPRSC